MASKLRLFSIGRHNLTSFWAGDYLALEDDSVTMPSDSPGGSVQAPGPDEGTSEGASTLRVETRSYGVAPPSGPRTELITVPRILGHAFNPASFFLERDGDSITGVRAEVHNTWGERHVYRLENRSDGAVYTSGAAKAFYVSPFLPMSGDYGFELREDGDGRLRIKIDLADNEGGPLFSGGIDLRPLALTDGNLARLLLAYPLVNLKTVAAIHWQGFKLWLRGVPFRANPSRKSEAGKGRLLWPRGH